MASKGILYNDVPLLNADGIPVYFDDATYPSGPPAECCCGETTCCCPQFESEETTPGTLTLTIVAPGCPEIDGASIELVHIPTGNCGATYGAGSHPIGNCGSAVAVGWSLVCDSGGAFSGGSCKDFKLRLSRSTLNCTINGSSFHEEYSVSCTCDPIELVFEGFIIDDSGLAPGSCDCCPGGFSVIITE
jgi:hypothetical protein